MYRSVTALATSKTASPAPSLAQWWRDVHGSVGSVLTACDRHRAGHMLAGARVNCPRKNHPAAIQHNRALCKVAPQPLARPAGSHNTCYVSRPRACGLVAARFVELFSPCPPLGVGSKTGLVMRRPSAFCCAVAARVGLFVVSCGKPRLCLMRGKLRYPHTHRLCAVVRSAPPRPFVCPRPPWPVSRCRVALRCSFPAPSARPPVRPGGAPPNQDHGEKQTPRRVEEAPAVCPRSVAPCSPRQG